MTDKDKEKTQLMRLADALVEDILQASEAEIIEEFIAARGDAATYATKMQAQFQKGLLAANRSRLRTAKKKLVAANAVTSRVKVVNITRARQILHRFLASPGAAKITLAARNESELSDADVLGMVDDLQELGLWTPENGEDEPS